MLSFEFRDFSLSVTIAVMLPIRTCPATFFAAQFVKSFASCCYLWRCAEKSETPLRALTLGSEICEPTTRLLFKNSKDHVPPSHAFGAFKLNTSYPQHQPSHQCASSARRSSKSVLLLCLRPVDLLRHKSHRL